MGQMAVHNSMLTDTAQRVVYLGVSRHTFDTLCRLPEFASRAASDNGEEHIEITDAGASLYLYHAIDDEVEQALRTG